MFCYTDFSQKLLENLSKQNSNNAFKIISITGSVAVGKSFFAENLCTAFNAQQPDSCQVLNLDHFLHPNAWIQKNLGMQNKGFPNSYQWTLLAEKLIQFKNNQAITIPVYDPIQYDILSNAFQKISPSPVLIIEGLHLISKNKTIDSALQMFPKECQSIWSYIDTSIYIDAKAEYIAKWYVERFEKRFLEGKNNERSYFYQFNSLSEQDRLTYANEVWEKVNVKNLTQYILPLKPYHDFIISKSLDHRYHKNP